VIIGVPVGVPVAIAIVLLVILLGITASFTVARKRRKLLTAVDEHMMSCRELGGGVVVLKVRLQGNEGKGVGFELSLCYYSFSSCVD